MTVLLSKFNGINTISDESRLSEGHLRECVNLDINNSGKIAQRGGFTEKSTDVFSCIGGDDKRCFAVKNNDLVEVAFSGDNVVLTTLKAGIGAVALDFAECDGDYYYVGNATTGVIKSSSNKSFGLPSIATQPSAAQADSGSLSKGTYLVAVTYLDANGLESGAVAPVSVATNTDGKMLSLTAIPVSTNPDVTKIAIYVSTRNGSELYRQKIINNGVTSTTVSAVSENGFPLATIGLNPAPYGSLIAYHYSHLYIANGEYLFYSEKFRYHQWNPSKHYKYPSDITAIMPCESGGMWIATLDGIYWLGGKTPKHGMDGVTDFINMKKHDAVIAKGSPRKIPAEYLTTGSYGWCATADQGIFILADNGQLVNATSSQLDLPAFTSCCGAIIKKGDVFNYLGIISGSAVPARTL